MSLRTADRWLILSVILAGFALRLFRIDHQSVWYDESFALTVSKLPWGDMTARLIKDFVHPPFHYYTLHTWFGVVGFGVLEARLLSAVFGTVAIGLLFVLARYLFDSRTAILAALLLTVSQLGVMYSQEARPYAEVLVFVLCTVFCFVVAVRERRIALWWGFVVTATLMVYTHYHAVLVILALAVYAVAYRRRYPVPFTWLVGGLILAGALYAPWLLSGVVQEAMSQPKTLPDRLPPWFSTNWSTLLSILMSFNNSRTAGVLNSAPPGSFLAGGLLVTAPAAWALGRLVSRRNQREPAERENLVLLVLLFLVPVAVTLGVAARGVQFDVRYVAYCAAPYYILAARGLATLPFAAVRHSLTIALVAFSIYALRANYFVPYKENYRDAFARVAEMRQPGDAWTFLPFGETVHPTWTIYHPGDPGLRPVRIEDVAANPTLFPRVWVFEYRRTSDAARKAELAVRSFETTHATADEREYFWIRLRLYTLKRNPAKD